jgi:hypothetical protein
MKQQKQFYNPFFKRFRNVDGPGGMTLHCWPFLDLTLTWHTDRAYRYGPLFVEFAGLCIPLLLGVMSALGLVILLQA